MCMSLPVTAVYSVSLYKGIDITENLYTQLHAHMDQRRRFHDIAWNGFAC